MKRPITEYIAQLCLIVFSVVLGIYLSERIEERKNKKEATKLLSRIKSEVSVNKKILEDWAPYHRKVVHNLDSLANDESFIRDFIKDESALFESVFTRGNLMEDMPSNDAWDIAKSHPIIVNFDYDELLILSRIYNQQSITFEPVSQLMELLLSSDFNTKEKAKSNLETFRNLMQEIAGREMSLQTLYNQGEEILGIQNN